jgi:hypothetical protein
MFPSVEFDNRTKGPHKNRSYIKGFGYDRSEPLDVTGTVVPFLKSVEK